MGHCGGSYRVFGVFLGEVVCGYVAPHVGAEVVEDAVESGDVCE